MEINFTNEEISFLSTMLDGATVQGADAMRVLITILDKLRVAAVAVPPGKGATIDQSTPDRAESIPGNGTSPSY